MTEMTARGEPIFVDSGLSRRLELAEAEGGASCEIALTFARPGSVSERNLLRNGFAVAYTRTKFARELPAK